MLVRPVTLLGVVADGQELAGLRVFAAVVGDGLYGICLAIMTEPHDIWLAEAL